MILKTNKAYKSIGEVAKILNLVNKKKGLSGLASGTNLTLTCVFFAILFYTFNLFN